MVDNALQTDSFQFHILISTFLDADRRAINQFWPTGPILLKCHSIWNPLFSPAACLSGVFFPSIAFSYLVYLQGLLHAAFTPGHFVIVYFVVLYLVWKKPPFYSKATE